MTTKLEAALAYASWGWHVLPVVPNGKVPATQHGVKDATTDAEQIIRWWTQNPNLNIGIAAGAKSGIVVFDVDPRNGGDDSWSAWVQENNQPPEGAMQMTAGGGQHYVASYHPEIRSCKLREGVDLLADGRYFVAFPSTIEGRAYEWEASSDPFDGIAPFTIPGNWLASYQAIRKQESKQVPSAAGGLIKGSRNSGLTALAGGMRRIGMAEAEILSAIALANETRCEIPLPSSEVAQIVRSVCRYEPELDIAADAGIGDEAAEALLAAASAEARPYYFTRATSYLSQPAPLRWAIKGWIPESSVSMVYGESGCGKTFITLDMACSMAAGIDWQGKKTKPGLVVYMAGEGNYGIRQRVAAWCIAHNISALDNLLLSNKAIDLDAPGAATEIIGAVRELTKEDALLIFVDTLHNHMTGDENSPRDTRALSNACNIVARALNSGVCINHHTGHSAEAKKRMRGSSAWKALLDVAVLVEKNDDELIEISCTKMKDAESPESIFGELQRVPLNWFNEDNEQVIGAIFKATDKPQNTLGVGEESFNAEHFGLLRRAWLNSGHEIKEGSPYISRSALGDSLRKDGLDPSKIKKMLEPFGRGNILTPLIELGVIEAYEHGFIVADGVQASAMMLQRPRE